MLLSSDVLYLRSSRRMPSSTQNLSGKDGNSEAEKSSHNEIISQNNKAENSAETAASGNFDQNVHVTESNLVFTKESNFDSSNEDGSAVNLEREKVTKSVAEELTHSICNRRVIMAYETHNRPRQPFLIRSSQNPATTQRLPVPPTYYSANTQTINQQRTLAIDKTPQSQEHRLQPSPFHMGELGLFPNFFINSVSWAQYPTNIPHGVPSCLAHLVDAEVLFIIQRIDVINLMTDFPDLNVFLILNKNNEYLYYVYETTDICGQLCCRNSRNFQLHVVDMYQNEVIYMNKPCGCTFLFCCYPVIEVYAPPMIPVGAVMKVFNPCYEEFVIVDPDENTMFKILGSNILKHCCDFYDFTFSIHAVDSQKTVVGYIRRDFGGLFRMLLTDADLYGISFPKNLDARIKAVFLGHNIFRSEIIILPLDILSICSYTYNSHNKRLKAKNWRVFQTGDKSDFKKGGEKDINKIRENDENLKMSIPSNSANVINFLQLIGKLKSLKRTGWVLRNVEDPETVSGHMYRMSIMTFLIPESSGVDKTRCMKLSLVHDLAECIVGDLTPYCGVDTSEKHRQEEVAMKELTQMIGNSGVEIYKLYKEYEAQVTEESKFVKDLDRLDMILQAFEYEKLGEKPGKLEEFFTSTINKFHFPWTIDIVKEIYKQRNLHINKDKSLGKDH